MQREKSKPNHLDHERKHVPGIVLPFIARELLCELTSAEWKVWTILFLHSNREGVCCLKNDTIIRESGVGVGTFHQSKRGLIDKRWVENWGQKDGRGPNRYKVNIPMPKPVADFTSALWDKLGAETWWDGLSVSEKFDYTDDHIDWLIGWRVIRTLRDADAKFTCADRRPWKPSQKIPEEVQGHAQELLLTMLRKAATSLNDERGLWWLWGDGLDLVGRDIKK